MRYFIFLSYKGTRFHGWQLQPGSVTIQEILDNALGTILNHPVRTTGAGRTDSGVHAKFFCAHFDSVIDNIDTDQKLLYRLNKYLPDDLSIREIRKVTPDAHARFSAVSRTYRYYISNKKDPFNSDSAWIMNKIPDIGILNKACEILKSESDFTSFAKLHSDVKTNICRIYEAGWEMNSGQLVFTIKADRFLRNMVRSIVGTMIDLGMGKYDIPEFQGIIEAKDRCRAGKSAPAAGLFLEEIEYPSEIFQ